MNTNQGYIFITGAGTGLGRALARRFVDEGEQVVLVGKRMNKIQALEQELGELALAISSDMSKIEQVEECFDTANRWAGQPKMVVHCAGISEFGALEELSSGQISKLLEVNLKSTILVAKQAVKVMEEQGGKLVNILSSAADTGSTNESVYCASKWGMRGFLETLRRELRTSAVKLVNIYPNGIKSEQWNESQPGYEHAQEVMSPAEVADIIYDALKPKRSCYVADLVIDVTHVQDLRAKPWVYNLPFVLWAAKFTSFTFKFS